MEKDNQSNSRKMGKNLKRKDLVFKMNTRWILILVIIIIIIVVLVIANLMVIQEGENHRKKQRKKSNKREKENDLICQIGSKSEDGLCKKDRYQYCQLSSDCSYSDFCFNNICLPRPNTYSEKMVTKYSLKNRIIKLKNHLFVLEGNTIKVVNWNIYNCKWVCQYSDSLTAVLTSDYIYLIDNKLEIKFKLKIYQTLQKIYKKGRNLYGIGNGYLNLLLNLQDGVRVCIIREYQDPVYKSKQIFGLNINELEELEEDNKIIMSEADQVFLSNNKYWIISTDTKIFI